MTRDEWCKAFAEEAVKLRPHLQPAYGESKLLAAIAASEWVVHKDGDPRKTAQAWHKRSS